MNELQSAWNIRQERIVFDWFLDCFLNCDGIKTEETQHPQCEWLNSIVIRLNSVTVEDTTCSFIVVVVVHGWFDLGAKQHTSAPEHHFDIHCAIGVLISAPRDKNPSKNNVSKYSSTTGPSFATASPWNQSEQWQRTNFGDAFRRNGMGGTRCMYLEEEKNISENLVIVWVQIFIVVGFRLCCFVSHSLNGNGNWKRHELEPRKWKRLWSGGGYSINII